MEYKIREESLVKENDKLAAVPVATNEWQKLASKGNKEFSVVQEISLIVNTVRDRIWNQGEIFILIKCESILYE